MNGVMVRVLRSPLHRMVSKSLVVIEYAGRRSGRRFRLPTQYVQQGDAIVVLVGRPATKSWWRNFRDGADAELLVRGRRMAARGQVVTGPDSADALSELRAAYLDRFPKAGKALDEFAVADTVFVRFTSRSG